MATVPVEQQETALTIHDQRPHEVQKFEFQQRCAKLFALSGLFADIKGQNENQSIAQAFVKIALGDSMGFNPAESMTGIDIILGRVSVGSSLRAARMQRAGYSWDILQLDEKGCRLRMKLNGVPLMCEQIDGTNGTVSEVPAIVSFMAEDAAKAQLISKDNYKKNPRNMFFARAITNAQRWYAPGILGVDILSTEEAIDMDPLPRNSRAAKGSQQTVDELREKYSPSSEGSASPQGAIPPGVASDPSAEQGELPSPQAPAPSNPSVEKPLDAQAEVERMLTQAKNQRGKKRVEQGDSNELQGVPIDFGKQGE